MVSSGNRRGDGGMGWDGWVVRKGGGARAYIS